MIGRRAFIVLFLAALALFAAASRAETIDDVFARCPTPAEIAAIDAIITISIEGNDTSQALACTVQGGSQNMSKLKRNIYNVLRAAQKIQFTQKLPWSNQTTIWNWLRFESGINLMRFRTDIGNSFCCDPSNAINIQINNNVLSLNDKWVEDSFNGGGLVSGLALLIHEARHRNGGGHTCGSNDQTLDQLGAWGAQIYFYLWLDRYVDPAYMRPNVGDAMYYRNWHIQTAEDLRRVICSPPAVTPGTVVEFHNSTLNHYFMTISPQEAAAIDGGSAGPGWTRTGVTFKAWPNSGEAPMNARPVCRFYGSITPGPNSHFYTVEFAECEFLKALQAQTPANEPRWNYEGIAFYVGTTVRPSPSSAQLQCGQIPNLTSPLLVNRFYNKRAQFNDSNHRYTISQAVGNQMVQLMWQPEGLVMCANP